MAEQREMSGTLSRNKRRENDRQPEFKGSATIDGVAYWISGWVKQGSEGEKFFSLSFTRKEQPSAQASPASRPNAGPQQPYRERTLDDDSIPF